MEALVFEAKGIILLAAFSSFRLLLLIVRCGRVGIILFALLLHATVSFKSATDLQIDHGSTFTESFHSFTAGVFDSGRPSHSQTWDGLEEKLGRPRIVRFFYHSPSPGGYIFQFYDSPSSNVD